MGWGSYYYGPPNAEGRSHNRTHVNPFPLVDYLIMRLINNTCSFSAWRRLLKAAVVGAALVVGFGYVSAQNQADLRFRQGKWNLDTLFSSNSARLDSIITPLQRLTADPQRYHIDSVRIIGGASPEGPAELNHRLSRHRAEVLAGQVSRRVALPDSLVSLVSVGRDWRGLLSLAERDEAIPARGALLPVIRSIIASNSGDSPAALAQIQSVAAGAPYAYIYSHLFPQLREARLQIAYTAMMPQVSLPVLCLSAPLPCAAPAEWIAMPQAAVPAYHKPFYMALKTNMLYDALAVPNIGAEFYLGRQWSVVGNWMYAWWSKDSAHRYWRIYGGDIAVRRWLGKAAKEKPLTGHHLGLYGGVVTYDFEFGGRGYMGGVPGGTLWDRCQYVAGIEYGYSLPVAPRLNIDFTIGIGYRQGKQVKYDAGEKWYVWKCTDMERWFGPTKAEISLVWLIGHGNVNARKGGAL